MSAPDYVQLIDTTGRGRYDVTPIFSDAVAFAALVDDLLVPFRNTNLDVIAGIDALGFVVGAAMALRRGVGFVPVRKRGKLPVAADWTEFIDYSGERKGLELRSGAISAGQRVLLVDEWIETGAQVTAAISLIERQHAMVCGIAAVAADRNDGTRALFERYRVCVVWDQR